MVQGGIFMDAKKAAVVRQFVYLRGTDGEYLGTDQLTAEEKAYVEAALAYKLAQAQCQYYARETGCQVLPADEKLRTPPVPVGRFR